MKTIIGIDNGPTGTIGFVSEKLTTFFETPTQDYLHYGKKGSVSTRLDREQLKVTLFSAMEVANVTSKDVRVFIERPFTAAPMMIKAMLAAHRFFEATIITLEEMQLGYDVIDSGEWQKQTLGAIKGSAELKKASKLRGIQLYPNLQTLITKHGDADGLLIAHHFAYRA